uniref:Uncharacterized protein n=1 Tax=Oryza sativa subsp. japonica TaxID=39947 RepID=Q6Z5N2_ORYSJ|nr:hypothetical protein [Oryza sativa Japonica Group]BAD16050.1 hypothetical protein [Oryza sativa Japonica Group]
MEREREREREGLAGAGEEGSATATKPRPRPFSPRAPTSRCHLDLASCHAVVETRRRHAAPRRATAVGSGEPCQCRAAPRPVQFRSAARKTRTRRRGHARGDVAKSADGIARRLERNRFVQLVLVPLHTAVPLLPDCIGFGSTLNVESWTQNHHRIPDPIPAKKAMPRLCSPAPSHTTHVPLPKQIPSKHPPRPTNRGEK